jgi:hypothetical protein
MAPGVSAVAPDVGAVAPGVGTVAPDASTGAGAAGTLPYLLAHGPVGRFAEPVFHDG